MEKNQFTVHLKCHKSTILQLENKLKKESEYQGRSTSTPTGTIHH